MLHNSGDKTLCGSAYTVIPQRCILTNSTQSDFYLHYWYNGLYVEFHSQYFRMLWWLMQNFSSFFFLTLQGCSSTCMFLGQSGVLLVQPTGFSYYLQWVFCGKISSNSQSGKFLKIWHFPFPGAHRSIETVVFDSNSHDHLNEVCISCSHNFRAFRSYRNLL